MERQAIESILGRRCEAFLDLTSMNAPFPNRYMGDAIGWACRMLGTATASPEYATDAELALVSSTKDDALLDLAELRLLEIVLNNLRLVTVRVGQVTEELGQLRKTLEALIPQKRDYIAAQYDSLLTFSLKGDDARRAVMAAL